MSKVYISIDPGVENGVAVYDTREPDRIALKTLSFFGVLNLIDATLTTVNYINEKELIVVVEDPGKISSIYTRHIRGANLPQLLKKAQNVGSNKRSAQLIIEYCNLNGISNLPVKPINRKGKYKAEDFEDLIGIAKSNQHVRDATLLLINIGVLPYEKIKKRIKGK